MNFEKELRQYFYILEDSFYESLQNFSKRTTIIYIILEIIALLSFLFFFIINLFFLIYSNKYIFQNILCIFIDFAQTKDYSFKNKYYNILAKKRVSNYILLLKEFNSQNLDSLKNDEKIEDISFLINTNTIIDEDINESIDSNNSKVQQNSNKIKKRVRSKKSKGNYKRLILMVQ
jgi:hypothetical protein